MELALSSFGVGDGLLLLALAAFCVTLTAILMRNRKPDPKMRLLVALMKDFPEDPHGGDPGEGTDDTDPRQEHGPLGPGGFSHIASGDSETVAAASPFSDPGGRVRGEMPRAHPLQTVPEIPPAGHPAWREMR